jgi:hypothetical protein
MGAQTEVRDKLIKAATKLLDDQAVSKKEEEKVEKSMDPGLKEAVQMILKEVSTADWSGTSGAFVQREHLDKQIKDITDRRTPFLDRVARVQANGKTHEWIWLHHLEVLIQQLRSVVLQPIMRLQ